MTSVVLDAAKTVMPATADEADAKIRINKLMVLYFIFMSSYTIFIGRPDCIKLFFRGSRLGLSVDRRFISLLCYQLGGSTRKPSTYFLPIRFSSQFRISGGCANESLHDISFLERWIGLF
jgi:hypothetical protein